jgi:hypothetical protein
MTPHQPARSGQPWTEEDQNLLVRAARDHADLETIAECAERTTSSVLPRLRRMLPLHERSCPSDMVARRVHEHLRDPDYDWRGTMLLTPPPRPVHKPPDIVRTGLPGLTDDDLVPIAHAVLDEDTEEHADLRERLRDEVRERRLHERLGRLHAQRMATRRPDLTWDEADRDAMRWMRERAQVRVQRGEWGEPWYPDLAYTSMSPL